jgi:Tol biopolymer transport system component
LRDIGDARLELEDAAALPAEIDVTAVRVAALSSRARIAWAAVALALCLMAVAILFLYTQRRQVDIQAVRFAVGFPDGWSSESTAGIPGLSGRLNLAVSPDGRRVVFVAVGPDQQQLLWVRDLGHLTARVLPGTEGASEPFWSPDSQAVAFFANGWLKKIVVSGGPAVGLCEVRDNHGGTWGADDVIVFAARGQALQRVRASGGTPTMVTRLNPGEGSHVYPSFLPDGRRILYRAIHTSDRLRPLYVTAIDSNDRTSVAIDADNVGRAANVVYSRGHLLFMSGTTLMAQPFDERRLAVGGEAVPIAENVRRSQPTQSASGYFSASAAGLLVYESGPAEHSVLAWYDRSTGRQLSIVGKPAVYFDVTLSPQGDQVAASIRDPTRLTADIWLYDATRGVGRPFTSEPGNDRIAIWSPDGSRIVFGSSRTAPQDLYQKSTDSAEAKESLLLEAPNVQVPEDWAPDGESILYGTNAPDGRRDLWILPLAGGRQPRPVLHGTGKVAARFSPNGRWIAYQSNESGRLEVYVAPFQHAGAIQQVSIDGGNIPRWRRDGSEIFFLDGKNQLVVASVDTTSDVFKVGRLRTLFQTRAKAGVYAFDVSPNGDRFLINSVIPQNTHPSLVVVLNWPAGVMPRN